MSKLPKTYINYILLFHNDILMHISKFKFDKIGGKNSTYAFRMTSDNYIRK